MYYLLTRVTFPTKENEEAAVQKGILQLLKIMLDVNPETITMISKEDQSSVLHTVFSRFENDNLVEKRETI